MKKFFPVLILLLGIAGALHGQSIRFSASVLPYGMQGGQRYLDVYSKLDASTVAARKGEGELWDSEVVVAVQVAGKLDVLAFTYANEDSASGAPILLQKSVFALEEGVEAVDIKVEIVDKVTDQQWSLEDKIDLPVSNAWTTTPVLIEDGLAMDAVPQVYHKSGQAIVPVAAVGNPIREDVAHLTWYTEAFVTEGNYIMQYQLFDDLGMSVPRTGGFKKCAPGNTPLLVSIPTAELASGNYTFKVWLRSSEADHVDQRGATVLLFNSAKDQEVFSVEEGAGIPQAVFEKNWGNWAQLQEYLSMIAPVASLAERRVLMNLKDGGEDALVAQFLVSFWTKRAPANPAETWKAYLSVVEKVNSEFGSKTLAGYKTQMGRVFLQYGAPSQVEERPFDGKNYPYQIWQYDELKSASSPTQQNQTFIFVDQELIGRQYTLIHSSALGEVKDHKWQYHLSRHTNAGPDIDATSTQYSRDNFGERISNSIIIGNQGTWFDRFNN